MANCLNVIAELHNQIYFVIGNVYSIAVPWKRAKLTYKKLLDSFIGKNPTNVCKTAARKVLL